MTETFTHDLDLNVKPSPEEEKIPFAGFAEPSKNIISNILNYSRTLEVKKSRLFDHIEILRS